MKEILIGDADNDSNRSQMSGSWSQNIPSRHAYHIHHPFEQQQLPKPRVYRSRTCSSDTTGSLRNSSGVLKPPRRWSGQDEGEWMPVDRDTFMYTTQDFTRVKTMLHKLYRLLQADGSVNPFEQNLNSPCRLSSLSEDSPFSSLDYKRHSASDHSAELARENAELRRQLIVAQRELDEKNSTIRQLQKQLLKLSETQPPSSDISHNL